MKNNKVINKIINESLEKIMSDRFGKYSKYVIQQRALPDVRDGLKPVHRRILYSMFVLGLFNDKAYKKSARIVGDVIGKYHPHGDSSVYDAMVNMSQWWKTNLPLLDMHGNIGSIDNDPAAAMRYTEVRMSKIAEYVLGDLKKKTVKFAPNFDDSEVEPVVLPSLFPNLIVNGSTGIAIGMATDMPPHNLAEVIDATTYRIVNSKGDFDNVNDFIKGPDFPTGGVIKGSEGILEALKTGRNNKDKIYLFSKYKVFTKDKNKFIEITEIPFNVVKSKLVYDIDLIIQNKDVDGIVEVKDQSDRNGINILITLDSNVNENSVLSYLFQKTDLKVNYSYNNTCIVNNSPKTLNMAQLIDEYIGHIKDVKTKTLTYDLEKAKLRLEIVEGFIKVAEISDEVIRVIRQSEGSKAGVIANLIKHFAFSENQARAIAELRLYRLSRTDKEAYLKEKAELEKQIKRFEKLLNSNAEFNKFLIAELNAIKQQFGTPRKTEIEDQKFDFSYQQTDLVKEEELNIAISKDGYVKRLTNKVIDSNVLETYQLKEGDCLTFYHKVNSLHNLLIFTNLGNYIIVPAYKINETKWKENGIHLSNFADFMLSEHVVSVMVIKDWNSNAFVTLGTKNGFFKKVVLKDFETTRINKSYTAIGLESGDTLINTQLSDGLSDIVILTEKGFASKYSETDISQYGTKAKGTKGVYLSLDDKVNNFIMISNDNSFAIVSNDGKIAKFKSNKITFVPKNNKGKSLWPNKLKFEISDIAEINKNTSLLVRDNLDKTFEEKIDHYGFSGVSASIEFLKCPTPAFVKFNKYTSDIDFKVSNSQDKSLNTETPKKQESKKDTKEKETFEEIQEENKK
ncbi:DNA topoisomerase IV subunit A [Mycoplasma nasistruthionis]|uniref:DNA topoisomerase (ATP-hydrolyzing) n=1 Tax=Mycoplasma nasistruthionis TaxID=353852 RepID=A0A5B7XVT7_9MOLU|nr:DNA topoisomerase IV subunit A [Mycoplasma nasistruthionis]QCZ36912.1 DNA topoisomerase IV subunit A [Mycoplasma nasistruthionis]